MSIALILFGLGIACYSISQLAVHNKIRWADGPLGFWGEDSDKRKYLLMMDKLTFKVIPVPAPNNFYYKYLARVKYKERWFTSTNLTVAFTDGYHSCQHFSFVLFSLSLSLATDINFFYVWIGILLTHFTAYRLLSK